jgi:cell division protein FtsQ
LQPLGRAVSRLKDFRKFPAGASGEAGETPDTDSWFSEAKAERAARIGFVASMIFLAAAWCYAAVLSGAAQSFADGSLELADHAAFDAGFRIENMSVSGAINTPKPAIMDALRLPYPASILSYDTARAHDELLKVGWIETAEVRRVFPSNLEITITERKPFARFEDGGKIQLIDSEGRLLGEDEGAKFGKLLLVAGEGAPGEAEAFAGAFKGRDALFEQVSRAELVAGRFWAVKLSNGLTVKLPRKVNALGLDRLETLLGSNKVAEMALETIDLRLSHRTILQLRDANVANRDKAISALMPESASQARKGRPL